MNARSPALVGTGKAIARNTIECPILSRKAPASQSATTRSFRTNPDHVTKSQRPLRAARFLCSPPKAATKGTGFEFYIDDEFDKDDDEDDLSDKNEEIYNIEQGWLFDDDEDDEDDEDWKDTEEQEVEYIAGLRLSPKLRKRLAQEAKQAEKPRAPRPKRGVHKKLRIISGKSGGLKLLSPTDENVRPMMEMVRGAVFSMLQAYAGTSSVMPKNTRWLDLFSGTGSIGLEAVSRGCSEAHFVEADPWVISNCLHPNIKACGVEGTTTVHTSYVEALLSRAADFPEVLGGQFDFISVTPPYEKVHPCLLGTFYSDGLLT
ncbi:hypothetical protein CYMTET_53894 [Cymbomonas tetramitiformis]|uniref:Uncharacterized protein n=1 Tax=Cymbomonas tetramitiformis TaxID=36881 RepID=A0AAE0EPA2_9CHLO|nr:hypothetical protein CYMTET_53894 [Cymbomonas tetramitiformis]